MPDLLTSPDAKEICILDSAIAGPLTALLAGSVPPVVLRILQGLPTGSLDGPVIRTECTSRAALTRRLARGEAPEVALAGWREAALALRKDGRRHVTHLVMVDAEALAAGGPDLRDLLAQRLGLVFHDIAVGVAHRLLPRDPVQDLVALCVLQSDPPAVKLAAEIDAMLLGARPEPQTVADLLGPAQSAILRIQDEMAKLGGPDGAIEGLADPDEPAEMVAGGQLGGIVRGGRAGVSLVTCCMNRTENLLKVLPSWLYHDKIAEIVIVDWSSRQQVLPAIRKAGLWDPRIKVVRVEGEPRWILSYAFNCGFRAARCATILKADADILISQDFFERNPLRPGAFVAGNWRTAQEGQNFVNGFFFVRKDALSTVGGFCEYITTYGWDDDDIYSRLLEAGFARQDVAPETVRHLDHPDDERIGSSAVKSEMRLLDEFTTGPAFLIRRNRYIAALMPFWHEQSPLVSFDVVAVKNDQFKLRRAAWIPSSVPNHVVWTARFHALLDFLFWKVGYRALQLDRVGLDAVLARKSSQVSGLDVEVALVSGPGAVSRDGGYLVIDIAPEDRQRLSDLKAKSKVAALIKRLAGLGYSLIVSARSVKPDGWTLPGAEKAPYVPAWFLLNDLNEATPHALLRDGADRHTNHRMSMTALLDFQPAPPSSIIRRRIYVDVQHGLGNRLRAIASAKAIADSVDREMVIIWETDDHCDARFNQLFDYDGEVQDRRFLDQAPGMGLIVQNYMPYEPGGEKDAEIKVAAEADLYLRSAFVFHSAHSDWMRENRALQTFRPCARVLDLVAAVRNPNQVCAHVRMEAGPGLDTNTWDRPENWRPQDHELIHHWRQKSHFSHFLTRLDALIAEGRADTIFLAADLPEIYAQFQGRYGERLAFLARNVYDRSSEQLVYALADAILLGRAQLMLGSTWSSFSELARRLSINGLNVEMSGKDF